MGEEKRHARNAQQHTQPVETAATEGIGRPNALGEDTAPTMPGTHDARSSASAGTMEAGGANAPDTAAAPATPAWARYANIPFRLLGYGILMGWHFLLIYFLATPTIVGGDLEMLFNRQLALNSALALTFAAMFALRHKINLERQLSVPFLAGTAIVGVASTAGAMYAALASNFAIMTALTAVSGAAEALLLLSWLHFYSETSNNYATQYLAFSLVIGALAAYLIRHLSLEVALFCFAALPALSTLMLASSAFQTPSRSATRGERGVSDHRGALAPLLTSTANLAVYSAVFGFLQGGMLPNGEPLLAAFTPNTVIGAGLAGAITMLVFHKVAGKRAPEMLRRIALFIFVSGVLITVYPWSATKEIAGLAIMMGFILTDISCLIFLVRLIRAYDLSVAFAVGFNRAVEYAVFALTIMCGSMTAELLGANSAYVIVTCGVLAMVVLGYALASMGQGPLDWLNLLYSPPSRDSRDKAAASTPDGDAKSARAEHAGEAPGAPVYGRFKAKCRTMCELSGLSPRESEVFMLMAKGRNAEYIQGALTISNYTAKTHIANIYRKVGVHSLQELIDTVEQTEASTPPDQEKH